MNQNLLNQLMQSKDKSKFLKSVLPPDKRNILEQFECLSEQEQAQKIADYCNQNNISLEKLKSILSKGIN